MSAVGAVLEGVLIVAVLTAAIFLVASFLGEFFRPITRRIVPERTWWYFARKQPERRLLILTMVALSYIATKATWLPFQSQTRGALFAAVVLFAVVEIVLGGARRPFKMRTPYVKRGERGATIGEALLGRDLPSAVAALLGRTAPRRSLRGQPSSSRRRPSAGAYCGAETARGAPCTRPVQAPGMRCYQHRGRSTWPPPPPPPAA